MRQRIITGLAAGIVFAGLLWLGGWMYTLLLAAMAVVGYTEFVKLNGQSPYRLDVGAAYLAVVLLTLTQLPASWPISLPEPSLVVWLIGFILLAATVFSKNKINLEHASVLWLGVVYIGFGFHFMLATRELEHGLFWSAVAFVCIWASDAGAYFTGKAVGKTKLWPAISPNKTVEGALGGLVASLCAGLIFALYQPEWLSFGQAAGIAVVAAVCGQIGDLIQSAYKRFRGVKDTGKLLPGHGGILDRTDSWLIVFPLLHLIGLLP